MKASIKIDRSESFEDDDWRIVHYEQRDDGWYVNTGHVDGQEEFRRYAIPEASPSTVRQLLRKEFDSRY